MSYISAVQQACPHLQDQLESQWIGASAIDRMPFVEYLASPANKAGITISIAPGRGKIKTVEVLYDRRLPESAVLANQANPNCAGGGFAGNEVATYTLDPDENFQIPMSIPVTANELACEDNSVFFARHIAKYVDALDRRVATELTLQGVAIAATGKWGANVDTPVVSDILQLPTFDLNAKPLPDTFIDLRNALDDSGYPGEFLAFGGATMRKYMQFLNSGCCADYGLHLGDIQSEFGFGYGHDKRVKDAHPDGQDGFIVVAPKALQILNFSRSEGKAAMGELWGQSSTYAYFTIRSPRLGLLYDVTLQDTCGTLNGAITFTGKVIGLPDDMYAIGDEYEGVKYAALGKALKCVDTACNEG
jgi:hypothetical protein